MIYLIPLLIVIFDQCSKLYMSGLLQLCRPGACESIEILPFFQFTLLHNSGAAFSFLSDAGIWGRWFLLSISCLVSVFISIWLYRIRHSEKLLALGLAFVLGGAVGNLIDRAVAGYVVDFIVLHWQQHYFPAFNIADSAITIGACLLLIDMIFAPHTGNKIEETNG
ncbi:MAG: signal peptidase II [Pseudomonadales bacterium]|nr:signal peptidase II [Pseudomonadales bacterium]